MLRVVAAIALALGLAVPAGAQTAGSTPKPAATTAVINLNTATAAQLESIPGIGAKTAERIIEYRQKNGAFKKVEDLMNVRGVGEKSFLKIKPLITVAPSRNSPQE